ncbi:MAG: DUF1824 family protein [Synechococcus sp.]|nr:DUF1824 family protein [Synechococcus sp.]
MAVSALADLRGLRTAPSLDAAERQALRRELDTVLAACDWFTVGVMAPTAAAAVASLQAAEQALGWEALQPHASLGPEGEGIERAAEGPVFLKGNQNTGTYSLRQESGLGEGLLISGHSPVAPEAEDTWGPLPLDFFA